MATNNEIFVTEYESLNHPRGKAVLNLHLDQWKAKTFFDHCLTIYRNARITLSVAEESKFLHRKMLREKEV